MAQDTAWTRRGRRLALTLPLAAVAAVGLVGCNNPQQHAGSATSPSAQPSVSAAASATASATPSVAPTFSATPTPTPTAPVASPTQSAPVKAKLNGTAHNGLTISNGTRYVVMDGKLADFGTPVRDLAWSPDGRKALFVNGAGDLIVSNPDGSDKVVAAKNPGGQTWSHPTWQVEPDNSPNIEGAKSILIFASAQGGTSRLMWVSATAVDGTPKQLPLNHYSDLSAVDLPQTGNLWPTIGHRDHAESVYANSETGDVYIRDDYLRQQGGVVTTGSEPAEYSDQEIVFVRSVGGHDHIFELDFEHNKLKDLTPHATTDYTEPAFSPDGKTIAVHTPDGISTLPADGSAAPVHISDYTGLPAYRQS